MFLTPAEWRVCNFPQESPPESAPYDGQTKVDVLQADGVRTFHTPRQARSSLCPSRAIWRVPVHSVSAPMHVAVSVVSDWSSRLHAFCFRRLVFSFVDVCKHSHMLKGRPFGIREQFPSKYVESEANYVHCFERIENKKSITHSG